MTSWHYCPKNIYPALLILLILFLDFSTQSRVQRFCERQTKLCEKGCRTCCRNVAKWNCAKLLATTTTTTTPLPTTAKKSRVLEDALKISGNSFDDPLDDGNNEFTLDEAFADLISPVSVTANLTQPDNLIATRGGLTFDSVRVGRNNESAEIRVRLKLHDLEELRDVVKKKQLIKRALADRVELKASDEELEDGNIYFAGDLLLTPSQADEILFTLTDDPADIGNEVTRQRRKRSISADFAKRWPRTIYYVLDSGTARKIDTKMAIRRAVDFWRTETCLDFKEEYPPADLEHDGYLVFANKAGCASYKGRIGGAQPIHCGSRCGKFGVMAHEMGHALGLWHEHQRPDRDEHVNIAWDNIVPSKIDNFYQCDPNHADSLTEEDCFSFTPYDLGSVMHYHPWAFTSNIHLQTIFTKTVLMEQTIGARTPGPTFYDVKQINLAYNCTADCVSKEPLNCKHGGYPDSQNECKTCKCPSGFTGKLCDTLETGSPAVCGGQVFVTRFPFTLSSPNHPGPYPAMQNCTWLLRAPADRKIEIEFTGSVFGFGDEAVCQSEYVEIKYKKDLANTGARFCGLNIPNKRIITEENVALILMRSTDSRNSYEGFQMQFKLYEYDSSIDGKNSNLVDKTTPVTISPLISSTDEDIYPTTDEEVSTTEEEEEEIITKPVITTTTEATTTQYVDWAAFGECVDETKECAWHGAMACLHEGAYLGRRNVSSSGKKCIPWDSQDVNEEHKAVGSHNFCRAFPGDTVGPWCYVDDSLAVAEFCFPLCNSTCSRNLEENRVCEARKFACHKEHPRTGWMKEACCSTCEFYGLAHGSAECYDNIANRYCQDYCNNSNRTDRAFIEWRKEKCAKSCGYCGTEDLEGPIPRVSRKPPGETSVTAPTTSVRTTDSKGRWCIPRMQKICVRDNGQCSQTKGSIFWSLCLACTPCKALADFLRLIGKIEAQRTTAPPTTTIVTTTSLPSFCYGRSKWMCEGSNGKCTAIVGSHVFQMCQICGRCMEKETTPAPGLEVTTVPSEGTTDDYVYYEYEEGEGTTNAPESEFLDRKRCPQGWQRWNLRTPANANIFAKDKLCFQPSYIAENWTDAITFCDKSRARLPTFRNKLELENFFSYLRNVAQIREVWVGLKDKDGDGGAEGEFWTDGIPFFEERVGSIFRWRRNQKNLDTFSHGCVVIDAARKDLRFEECKQRLPIICQIRLIG